MLGTGISEGTLLSSLNFPYPERNFKHCVVGAALLDRLAVSEGFYNFLRCTKTQEIVPTVY